MELFHIRYRLVILKKVSDEGDGEFEHVKTLRISLDKSSVSWREQTYYYSPKEVSYRKGRTCFIFKELENGNTVFKWGQITCTISPTDVSQKNKEKLINKALSTNPNEFGLVTLIVAVVGALCGGLFLMTILYPHIFPQMVKEIPKMVMLLCR